MQAVKKNISNFASVAKERMTICKAKVEEQAELATARTAEEKELARERRKAKEAQAKLELHQAKAKHAAEKLSSPMEPHPTLIFPDQRGIPHIDRLTRQCGDAVCLVCP